MSFLCIIGKPCGLACDTKSTLRLKGREEGTAEEVKYAKGRQEYEDHFKIWIEQRVWTADERV